MLVPPSKRTCALLAGMSVAAVLAALSFPSGTPASYPSAAQRLLVKSEDIGGLDLDLIDEQGRKRASLAAEPGLNGGVAVARQGTAFAYVDVSSPLDLPADLPARIRRRFDRGPQVRLAFGTFLNDVIVSAGNSVSFTIGLASRVVRVVPGRPAWSRDGRRIVVSQAQGGRVHLFSYAVRGLTGRHQLTHSPGRDLNPRFAPDGRTIVFERHLAGQASLLSIRADGTALRQLTYWAGDELSPDFAPDGRSLVFTSNASGRYQLYVLSLADNAVRRLTSDFGNDRRPVWSPDGRWIAFSSDRDGDNDAYLIDPSGNHERKLTHNASEDLVEDWQPLHDPRPPMIRALPGSGPRGEPAVLRFSLREDSPIARVVGVLLFSHGESDPFGWNRGLVRTKPARIHVIRVPYENLVPSDFEEEGAGEPPQRFRFCLAAVDPSGNQSTVSCATYRFRS
jgi:WD40-like Beta Propeller Repeat